MTKIKSHPNIKRMRIQLFMETMLIGAFIAVYYNGFCGVNKPIWANTLLTSATILYIMVRFVGWFVLRNPINRDNLKNHCTIFNTN